MKQLLIILLMLALLAGCATQAEGKSQSTPNVKVEEINIFTSRITDYDNGIVCFAVGTGGGAGISCLDRPLPSR